jgi:L-fuconolactonase
VFVECTSMYRADGRVELRCVGETEFANGIAAMAASGGYGPIRVAAGIASRADLSLGTRVGAVLDAHMAVTPRFKGIRHAAAWDASADVPVSHTKPPRGLLLDPTFRKGFAELGKRGLSFEGWLYHPQIPELTDLARAFDDTTIILNHFGGPLGIGPYEGRQAEVFADWRRAMTALAACPNVVVKLGGILMPRNGHTFHKRERPPTSDEIVATVGDYYHAAIELFGANRCMFESNFPVDRVSCSYAVLWNAFKKIAAGASPSEKAALFHDCAARTYRLEN